MTPLQQPLCFRQVEVEPGHCGGFLGLPSPLANRHKGQAGGDHKALLRCGAYQIAVPSVYREGDAAEAAYGVHQQQFVKFLLGDAGDFLQRMGDAGRCFVVGDHHRLDFRIVAEGLAQGVGVYRTAPLEIQPPQVGAESHGHIDEAVAEGAGGGGDHLVAGGKGVHQRRFQGAGAGGGEDE